MSPPKRPPSFFNALTGAPLAGDAAQREAGNLLDDLARDVGHGVAWDVDDDSGQRFALRVERHLPEQQLEIAVTGAGAVATLIVVPDDSGYLRIELVVGGKLLFTGYVEQIWEEFDIWPPDASAETGTEAPGRMGKRRNWLSLSVAGWPALAAIANAEGWLNLMLVER
ncbi:hypothetical protein [Devosia sp.]|uniref:hypothetical protein n=1 Tax=Devosia sp. TaxID=1871048 RepID=UPI003A95CA5F